jgi:hypothetical protein
VTIENDIRSPQVKQEKEDKRAENGRKSIKKASIADDQKGFRKDSIVSMVENKYYIFCGGNDNKILIYIEYK